MQSTGKCLKSNNLRYLQLYTQCLALRLTKQISVTKNIKAPLKIPYFAYILEKGDFEWGGGQNG
jgi:hypothetical protein